jgi:hypothetical protein
VFENVLVCLEDGRKKREGLQVCWRRRIAGDDEIAYVHIRSKLFLTLKALGNDRLVFFAIEVSSCYNVQLSSSSKLRASSTSSINQLSGK